MERWYTVGVLTIRCHDFGFSLWSTTVGVTGVPFGTDGRKYDCLPFAPPPTEEPLETRLYVVVAHILLLLHVLPKVACLGYSTIVTNWTPGFSLEMTYGGVPTPARHAQRI